MIWTKNTYFENNVPTINVRSKIPLSDARSGSVGFPQVPGLQPPRFQLDFERFLFCFVFFGGRGRRDNVEMGSKGVRI